MRNMLAFAAALVLTFAVVGYYLDWYKVKSDPLPAGHHSVNIDINGVKVVKDLEKGEQKIHDAIEKTKTNDTGTQAQTDPGKIAKPAPNEE